MEEENVRMDEFAVYLNGLYWEQAMDDLPAELIAYEYIRFSGGDADALLLAASTKMQGLRQVS